MARKKQSALVTTDWLAESLDDPRIKVIDSSWYMPAQNRNPRQEYLSAHIPGAVFFDIDGIADTTSPLPHMLPGSVQFSQAVGELGLNNEDHLVIYDGGGMASSARGWWTFRTFGHAQVSVLDGGLRKWMAEDRPTESGDISVEPASYHATLDPGRVRDVDQVLELVKQHMPDEQIIDARSSGRFHGSEPEPRAGLRGGHMPWALNVPASMVLDDDGTMKQKRDLQGVFAATGFAFDRPIVTTCGSGITAALLALGLHIIGYDDVAVYDGSWTEWGSREDTPIV